MAFIDYYKILGVPRDIPQRMFVRLTASVQNNSILIFIPMIRKLKPNFKP